MSLKDEVEQISLKQSRASDKSIGDASNQSSQLQVVTETQQHQEYSRQNQNKNLMAMSEIRSEMQASLYSKYMLHQIHLEKRRDPRARKRRQIAKIFQVMLLIISIPMQVVLSNWLMGIEIGWLKQVQQHLSFDNGSLQVKVFNVVRFITRMDAMVNFHMISFLSSDSLLAYKTTLCYCLGSFLMTILKLAYAEPRPYWTERSIKTPNNECDFSFGNPTQSTFNFIFFFSYSAYMQLYRYVKVNDRKKWQIWLAAIFIILGESLIIFMSWINGISFLYQQLISLLYTSIFITGCINFDKEIMTMCENSGFILRSSRRNKFSIFFASILAYILIYGVALSFGDPWTNNIKYVENAYVNYRENCPDQYAHDPNAINYLGAIKSTNTAVLMFYLIGIAFGAPYSMTRINVVDWIRTTWWKKLIRVTIALGFTIGLLFLLITLFQDSQSTLYYIVFYISVGFFMYGPYVYLCCQRNLLVSPYTSSQRFNTQINRDDSLLKYEEKGLEDLSSMVSGAQLQSVLEDKTSKN